MDIDEPIASSIEKRTMKKKILFIINQFYRGGAETVVLNSLNALKNDYSIDFIVYDHIESRDRCSLLPYIPKEINLLVCKGTKRDNIFSYVPKLFASAFTKELIGDIRVSKKIRKFTKDKRYELALACGEWVSLDLLAFGCHALKKGVWIQGDIKQSSIDKELFFSFDQYIDYYIFVSKPFLDSVLASYPFLARKSQILDNLLNFKEILDKSLSNDVQLNSDQLNLLSIGNIRIEKGYEAVIKISSLLRKKKVNFCWRIVGAASNVELFKKLQTLIKEESLENNVFLLGPLDNPYSLLRKSDQLISTSIHESWSLVISEAIFLKTPVVSSKTVGAVAQITSQSIGVLVNNDPEEFVSAILKIGKKKSQEFSPAPSNKISDFKKEFNSIVLKQSTEKEILIVIDDINYLGGAHLATLNLANSLSKNFSVALFSGVQPTLKTRLKLVKLNVFYPFLSQSERAKDERLPNVLSSNKYSKRVKACRFFFSIRKKLVGEHIKEKSLTVDGYKVIYVMSEGSQYRKSVAKLDGFKIQAIHTDYFSWSQLNTFTKTLTKDDAIIYQNFDKIICVSKRSAQGLNYLLPSLSNKVEVLPNLLTNLPEIKIPKSTDGTFRILTVARLEAEKDIPRMLRVAQRLKADGFNFHWVIIGGGRLLAHYKSISNSLKIDDKVSFLGSRPDPFSNLASIDLFALLSHYEGLPNTIFEAFSAGIPVLATSAAGEEQIIPNVNGFLVEDDEVHIYYQLKNIISEPAMLENLRKLLSSYSYDNASTLKRYNDIFSKAIKKQSK